jgi:hypothetical protein
MSVRLFDWRDLPALYNYRNKSVFLHSSLVLTRGSWTISGALLSSFAPTAGISTYVSVDNGDTDHKLIGQTIQTPGSQIAQLTFLAPEEALDSGALPGLLEYLSGQAISGGAFRLLADVEEGTMVFDALRVVGFAIYARQRIWQLVGSPSAEPTGVTWRTATDRDVIAIRSLYNNLMPGLVQQVEPFLADRLSGLVHYQEGTLLGYVELKYGHRGVWVQPFIHPDAEHVADGVIDLVQNLPRRLSRPLYICVRSYQSWLEPRVEELGAKPGPRQALMVKHLAIPKKAVRSYALPAIEGGRPEVTTPITQKQNSNPQAAQSIVAGPENS